MPDSERPTSDEPPAKRTDPLLWRVVRSAIAPDVLEDGGADAPLSRRGKLVFYAIVTALVVGIVVLLLVTASSR